MEATRAVSSDACRRQGDRRQRPTTFLGALVRRGSRRDFRRTGEHHNQYVDRVGRRTLVLTIFVLVACALDALWTLIHLDRGASEWNPLMARVLEGGPDFFVAVKITITALGVWLIAAHQNFRVGRQGLYLIAGGYVALLAYHVALFVG